MVAAGKEDGENWPGATCRVERFLVHNSVVCFAECIAAGSTDFRWLVFHTSVTTPLGKPMNSLNPTLCELAPD